MPPFGCTVNRTISRSISCHITFFSCHISWKAELIVLACLYIKKSLELVELWHARTPSSESRGVPHQSQPNGRFAGFQENQAPSFKKTLCSFKQPGECAAHWRPARAQQPATSNTYVAPNRAPPGGHKLTGVAPGRLGLRCAALAGICAVLIAVLPPSLADAPAWL